MCSPKCWKRAFVTARTCVGGFLSPRNFWAMRVSGLHPRPRAGNSGGICHFPQSPGGSDEGDIRVNFQKHRAGILGLEISDAKAQLPGLPPELAGQLGPFGQQLWLPPGGGAVCRPLLPGGLGLASYLYPLIPQRLVDGGLAFPTL